MKNENKSIELVGTYGEKNLTAQLGERRNIQPQFELGVVTDLSDGPHLYIVCSAGKGRCQCNSKRREQVIEGAR